MSNQNLNEQWLNIPNILTAIRLLAIPVMVHFILDPARSATALFLMLVIWMTDVLDGFIARRLDQITNVGKVLDPLTDKLFQAATAIALWVSGRLPLWVPLLLLINQLLMVGGGIFLWREGTVVHSNWYGKLCTVLLVACFAILFLLPADQYWVAHFLFIVPVALSFYATVMYGVQYLMNGTGRRHGPSDGV